MLRRKYLVSLICFVVFAYVYFSNKGQETVQLILKPLATILVILIPVLFAKIKHKYKEIIVLSLSFCLLGDVLLLFENLFVFGLISFLIAHILFARSFVLFQGFLKNYMVLSILSLYAISCFLYLKSSLNQLLIPVAIYIFFILIMVWQGLALVIAKRTKAFKLIATAVVLFFISDSVLAVNKFKSALPFANEIIAMTYWSAITLIALSTTEISNQDFAPKNIKND